MNENEKSLTAPSGTIQIEQTRAQKEIESRIVLARRFPRDLGRVRDQILVACKSLTFAEKATYKYPRHDTDGKKVNIKGISIRLAEEMARAMTNFMFGMREIDSGSDWTDVQTFAWDIESNVSETREFRVPHYRKAGSVMKRITDPRDVYELTANMGSRRMRACIMAQIPYYLQDEAISECDKTIVASITGKAGAGRAKKMMESFEGFKITAEHIEKRYEKKLKNFSPEEYADLIQIYNALRDGIAHPWDYFDIAKPEGESEGGKAVRDDLMNRDKKETAPGAKQPEPPMAGNGFEKNLKGDTAKKVDDEIKQIGLDLQGQNEKGKANDSKIKTETKDKD